MEEQWKPVAGFPKYEVSSYGNVRSLDYNHTHTSKILRPMLLNSGYLAVVLYKEHRQSKAFSIHRLVASMFIPNPNNLRSVNHKDENKLNNNVANLEWCTDKYNHNYGTKPSRLSIAMTDNPNFTKAVYQIDKAGNIINEFSSISRASRATGIPVCNISHVCLGLKYRHTAGGFIWKFKN